MAPATYEPIFLTNLTASNVQGRPDRGSTWLGIPSANSYGEVTIKKEHNMSFSVVVLEKGVVSTSVSDDKHLLTSLACDDRPWRRLCTDDDRHRNLRTRLLLGQFRPPGDHRDSSCYPWRREEINWYEKLFSFIHPPAHEFSKSQEGFYGPKTRKRS